MKNLRAAATLAVAVALSVTSSACNAILGLDKNYTETDCFLCDGSVRESGMSEGPEGGSSEGASSEGSISQEAIAPIADTGTSDGPGALQGSETSADIEAPEASTSPEGSTCAGACTAGESTCMSNGILTCEKVDGSCAEWVTIQTCPADEACTVTNDVASCGCQPSACTQPGKLCQDSQTLATCTQDANGCYQMATTSCASPQVCSGLQPDASCALTCADSCTAAQTTCLQGGKATCTRGTNGCLAFGTPAPCGPHQTCASSGGSASCACNASVCTAAGNTCADSVTLATCASDAQGCFYEASTMTCSASCVDAKCGCTPGSTQCGSGNTTETCAANGTWSTGQVVPNSCGAVCTPGSTGGCASTTALQTCSNTGVWSSTPCGSDVCTAGACVSATAIAVGGYANALMADGSVQCWGTSPIPVPGIPGIPIALFAGVNISCAILSDNTVACWDNCGDDAARVSGLKAKWLTLKSANPCAVLLDGSVQCGASLSTLSPVSGISNVTQVVDEPDGSVTCALEASGTVWCWGDNGEGELGVPTTTTSSATPVRVQGITNAQAISAGGIEDDDSIHVCALLSTGAVTCWGGNYDGPIGNGAADNSPVSTPYQITAFSNAISVAAGDDFSCAVLSGGTVQCWGANFGGMLGTGGTTASPSPTPVSGVSKAATISADYFGACVLNTDGSVQCWGSVLGDGSTAPTTSTPVYVTGI